MAMVSAYDPRRRAWADSYANAVADILRQNAGLFVELVVADPEADMQCATDFVIRVRGGDVACRVRREEYWRYRDVTFRHQLRSGLPSETDKIRQGFAYWMFYGWVRASGDFRAWVLIDLDRVRARKLFDLAEAQGQVRSVLGGNQLLFLTLDQLGDAVIASGGELAKAA